MILVLPYKPRSRYKISSKRCNKKANNKKTVKNQLFFLLVGSVLYTNIINYFVLQKIYIDVNKKSYPKLNIHISRKGNKVSTKKPFSPSLKEDFNCWTELNAKQR